ncbi:uncharacterized protein LOC6597825 isoform X1 [Drosophila persimilis]|uniref:uncharacterized protein LOC6597825 isoform X1 n=1 Tax=Drosophila persimilis TaxID=7234 RepID=UPI000F07BDB9|nr:uncharacterized protein LOC6597825 isoform X1 [Drosophila persimilis]
MARSVRYWLPARTKCTGATGAPRTFIKTGQPQPRQERALHSPQLRQTAQMCRCRCSGMSMKARRLLFSAIRPSFGPESMAMSVWNWKESRRWPWTNSPINHAYRTYRHRWKEQPYFDANLAGNQHCRLGGFVYWLDDKTGVERITVNEERRSAEL